MVVTCACAYIRMVCIKCRLDGGCLDWQDQWKKFVKQYGRYKHCYAKVKRAWVRIEEFIKSLAKDRPG